MKSLAIVFAGTPEFAIPSLEAIAHSHHHLKAIYTQPDRPAGRGRKLQSSAVKIWAQDNNYPMYQPLNFKDNNTALELAALKPDVMVVIAYGLLLPRKILEIPTHGCINVHASLLPKYRGASPIQQTILHGERITGVTIMQLDVGMDTGPILMQTTCNVAPQDTAQSLQEKLSVLATTPLLETLDNIAKGTTHASAQNHALATHAPKITKEDARIDWTKPALEIAQKIRAYNPWPIAFMTVNDSIIRIHQATVTALQEQHLPGTILSIDKTQILIATGHDAIAIHLLQFPGSKIIKVSDLLNAQHNPLHVRMVLS